MPAWTGTSAGHSLCVWARRDAPIRRRHVESFCPRYIPLSQARETREMGIALPLQVHGRTSMGVQRGVGNVVRGKHLRLVRGVNGGRKGHQDLPRGQQPGRWVLVLDFPYECMYYRNQKLCRQSTAIGEGASSVDSSWSPGTVVYPVGRAFTFVRRR